MAAKIVVSAPPGCRLGGKRLERVADLAERGQLGVGCPELSGDRRDHVVDGPQQVDAVAVADVDQTFYAQRGEGLPQRRAADPEAPGKLPFRGQSVARLERCLSDEVTQLRLDAGVDRLSSLLVGGRHGRPIVAHGPPLPPDIPGHSGMTSVPWPNGHI